MPDDDEKPDLTTDEEKEKDLQEQVEDLQKQLQETKEEVEKKVDKPEDNGLAY